MRKKDHNHGSFLPWAKGLGGVVLDTRVSSKANLFAMRTLVQATEKVIPDVAFNFALRTTADRSLIQATLATFDGGGLTPVRRARKIRIGDALGRAADAVNLH